VEALGGDVVEGIRRVKAGEGPELIVWGSSTVTSMLLEQGLAEEVLLFVYPIPLGTGKRFFLEGTPARGLTLVGTEVAASGVLIHSYTFGGDLRTGSFEDAAG
jgi:dihydrofolate reductase